jgi:hypothetical protein
LHLIGAFFQRYLNEWYIVPLQAPVPLLQSLEASLNLAYMYFLGLNPEENLPERSLLSKFRRHRAGEIKLDLINTEIVRQCVEKGVIVGKSWT